MAGDSAGGNLALVLCPPPEGRRAPAAPGPAADVPLDGYDHVRGSPTGSGRRSTPCSRRSISKPSGGPTPGAGISSTPDLSPLLGDLADFPPTLIQVGDHEILYSDSASLAAALRCGRMCPAGWRSARDMWHVFQMFPIKKAAAAMESAARFLLEL